ncbi:guanine deaminase [soil metagenome]
MTELDEYFMRYAISLAQNGIDEDKGGPFGAIVVRNGEVIGEGCNRVTSTNDPTAHAEIVAIRNACENIGNFQLENCTIYTSCEPCPMCLGAIYWARPTQMFFACTREDAANVGFDDQFIYEEIEHPIEERKINSINFLREEGLTVFTNWANKTGKIEY